VDDPSLIYPSKTEWCSIMEPIKHLKSRQPLGKLQRKILFVMIHTPDPNELFPIKMPIRYIADIIYGEDNHSAVNRKIMRQALKGLRQRRLTDGAYELAYTHVVGQWWLTAQGKDLNVGRMVKYWKEEDPQWFDEVVLRLPPEGFFKNLSYERKMVK